MTSFLLPYLRGITKRTLDHLLRPTGLEVRRQLGQVDRLSVFLRNWKRLGPPPRLIIDVGANRGAWTRTALRWFPDARFILVEPQEAMKEHVRDLLLRPNIRWLTAGASNRSGALPLTVINSDCDATFRFASAQTHVPGVNQVMVPMTTLDDICAQESAMPDLVKVDAEGIDLDVLHGSLTLLGRTDIFLVECSVCAPGFPNSLRAVCDFMEERNYRLFDITHLNVGPRNGLLWLTECVFLRCASPVWANLGAY